MLQLQSFPGMCNTACHSALCMLGQRDYALTCQNTCAMQLMQDAWRMHAEATARLQVHLFRIGSHVKTTKMHTCLC
eukprot:980740-Pelagomonas_calceolata.AAC.2